MRTDATRVCLTCKTRFTRLHRVCPVDARHGVLDLRDDDARRDVEAMVEPRELPAPVRTVHRTVGGWMDRVGAWVSDKLGHDRKSPPWWWWLTGLPMIVVLLIVDAEEFLSHWAGLVGLLFIGLLTSFMVLITANLALLFAVLGVYVPFHIACGLLRVVEWGVRRVLHERQVKRYPRLQLLAPPEPRPGGEKVRGVVKAAKTVPSGLEGRPCVAWRVSGRAHWGDVDDAGGGDFELDAQEGPVTVSLGGGAWVDVSVFARPRPRDPTTLRQLAWWPRSLVPPKLAEALIRVGDEVEVEGGCEVSSESDGYRTTRVRRAFRERDGAPLVVRLIRRG